MNEGVERYKNDERIISIHGYMYPHNMELPPSTWHYLYYDAGIEMISDDRYPAYEGAMKAGFIESGLRMIVAAALIYGEGDYGKSICMAVETGFDTDCNGATVGSVLGMANGIESIPECWTSRINDTLHTSIFGVDTVRISDRVKMTMKHVK